MSEPEESIDEGPCEICVARRTVADLKDAIDRKLSLVQLFLNMLSKTLEEAKALTTKPT
jgi:hypothetical protein